MKTSVRTALAMAAVAGAAWVMGAAWGQQASTAPATQGAAPAPRGRGIGRGGLAGATPSQNAAIADMNAAMSDGQQAVIAARANLLAASLAWPRDDAAAEVQVETLQAAEAALADERSAALAKIQASDAKLSPAQIATLGTGGRGGGGGAAGRIPHMSSKQVSALTQMTGAVQKPAADEAAARAALATASLTLPRDPAAVKKAVEALTAAETALAKARADALAALQNSPEKLSADQLAALVANNGVLVSGSFSEPLAMDFNDHEGYVSLFDGKTLKGWDGNPKFWRVEDGAIVGESTQQNPSGNTYIACRDSTAKDFTLKFEMKVEGAGGSGMQYRSKTGIPWLTAIPANVTANNGPVNLDWMMTGPQADFWPSRDTSAMYSGQFYSENTPMRIMAFRGQVVEGFGMGPRRLMGNIGDRLALGKLIKADDWNQYTVIARGGTFLHLINGQLMSVMIDDDPDSSNNQPGLVGIEIEQVTKVSVRNIWMKKLD